MNNEIAELRELVRRAVLDGEDTSSQIASLLTTSYLPRKLLRTEAGEKTWMMLHEFGENCLRVAIASIPSTTITAAAMQHSLSPLPTVRTADLFLLGEEGTLIVPSAKLFSSMKVFFAVHGVSITQRTPETMILTSDLSSEGLEAAVGCFWDVLVGR